MNQYYLLLLSFLWLSLPAAAQKSPLPDSLLNERYIQRLQLTDPQRALQLLDEAERRHIADFPRYRQLALRST